LSEMAHILHLLDVARVTLDLVVALPTRRMSGFPSRSFKLGRSR
jgi:hypothetical protein